MFTAFLQLRSGDVFPQTWLERLNESLSRGVQDTFSLKKKQMRNTDEIRYEVGSVRGERNFEFCTERDKVRSERSSEAARIVVLGLPLVLVPEPPLVPP